MGHRYQMSETEVRKALLSAYEASNSSTFNNLGFLGVVGSTYENAGKFHKYNKENTGSHDIDVVALPRDNYNLNGFLKEFYKFWLNYSKEARKRGMYTSTYSDSSHETHSNWITSKFEGEDGKIPGHALIFLSRHGMHKNAPKGFCEAVENREYLPLHGSLENTYERQISEMLDEFISEFIGPVGPLVSDSFPKEIEWKILEQIVSDTDKYYSNFIENEEKFSEVKRKISTAANSNLESLQLTPKELHHQTTDSLASNINPAV